MKAVALIAVMLLVAQDTVPTLNVRVVGDVTYHGPHTWSGVIEVTQDDITYKDGTITAPISGVPQGVTFHGDRKRITLRNLTFNGVGDGISINNNQRVDYFTIDGCKFLDTRSPDSTSTDVLMGQRGLGIFGSAGRNWTITKSEFRTKAKDESNPEQKDCSAQYACRLANVTGLNVSQTRFENWAGKACVWLMFVRAAAFDQCHFEGGSIRIGMRPNDVPGIEKGDCRNIIFRNCTFKFGVLSQWPASITIFPGAQSVSFENCTFQTAADAAWWIEIDERDTSDIHWKNCTWNGEPITEYKGVRSSMDRERMRRHNIGPSE